MAGVLTRDLDGSTFQTSLDGNSWSRRFRIDGLLSGPDIPSLYDEIFAVLPDPGSGAPLPIENMPIRENLIERIWCVPDSVPQSWSCIGTTVYTTPTSVGGGLAGSEPNDDGPGITLSSSSSVQEIDVYYNTNGTSAADQLVTVNDGVTQAHRVSGFAVAETFTFSRLESTNPRSRNGSVIGKLNAGLWNDYPVRTVLLSDIEVNSDDGGTSYVVTYTFEQRPTWDAVLIHDDPFFPGNPLPLTEAVGLDAIKIEKVLFDADFNQLNITLP